MATRKQRKNYGNRSKPAIVVSVIVVILAMCYVFVQPFHDFVDGIFRKRTQGSVSEIAGDFPGLKDGELAVHFIDVGQGDSILIQLPNGKNMLIDGGDNKTENKNAVKEYLTAMRVETLDYLMATHFDADHIGGLASVFDYTEVKQVYIPKINEGKITTAAYRNLMTAIQNEGCPVNYSEINMNIDFSYGENKGGIYWLSPEEAQYKAINDNEKASQDSLDLNNVSPIMLLTYQGKKIVFTGDANCPIERQVVKNFGQGLYGSLDLRNIDLLKAGHHGSNGTGKTAQTESGSSCQEFLDLLTPKSVVISVGAGNSYGHPHSETLKRFDKMGSAVYRTDERGNVIALVTKNAADTLQIYTEKQKTEQKSSEKADEYAWIDWRRAA